MFMVCYAYSQNNIRLQSYTFDASPDSYEYINLHLNIQIHMFISLWSGGNFNYVYSDVGSGGDNMNGYTFTTFVNTKLPSVDLSTNLYLPNSGKPPRVLWVVFTNETNIGLGGVKRFSCKNDEMDTFFDYFFSEFGKSVGERYDINRNFKQLP
jgi:hypothetical protein